MPFPSKTQTDAAIVQYNNIFQDNSLRTNRLDIESEINYLLNDVNGNSLPNSFFEVLQKLVLQLRPFCIEETTIIDIWISKKFEILDQIKELLQQYERNNCCIDNGMDQYSTNSSNQNLCVEQMNSNRALIQQHRLLIDEFYSWVENIPKMKQEFSFDFTAKIAEKQILKAFESVQSQRIDKHSLINPFNKEEKQNIDFDFPDNRPPPPFPPAKIFEGIALLSDSRKFLRRKVCNATLYCFIRMGYQRDKFLCMDAAKLIEEEVRSRLTDLKQYQNFYKLFVHAIMAEYKRTNEEREIQSLDDFVKRTVAKILDYACKMIISMGLEEKEGKEKRDKDAIEVEEEDYHDEDDDAQEGEEVKVEVEEEEQEEEDGFEDEDNDFEENEDNFEDDFEEEEEELTHKQLKQEILLDYSCNQ